MEYNWQEWIDKIGSKDVTEAEIIEFQNILKNSPENQRQYIDALLVEAALETEFQHSADHALISSPSEILPFPSQTKRASVNWKPLALPMVASISVLVGLAYFLGTYKATNAAEQLPISISIATITDTNLHADENGMQIGQLLQQGEINVPEHAEIGIAMRGGARLEINGPAKLRLDGPEKVFLHNGRVKTYAPKYAHGFSINTDEGKIIDLGTRFVTSTGGDQGTEIHVLEGLVEASSAAKKDEKHLIRDEQAAALTQGKLVTIDYLANRLRIPINPELLDTDGDGVADEIETHYKTDINDPKSVPNLLRIEEGFNDYQPGRITKSKQFLGTGNAQKWQGSGNFLKNGLSYERNGNSLATSPGSIQTSGHGGENATILFDSNEFPDVGSIYISFLMQQPAKDKKHYFSGLLLYSNEFDEQLFLGEVSSTAGYGSRMRIEPKDYSFNIPHDQETHLYVVKIDQTRQITDIFIDPKLGELESESKPNKRYQHIPKFDRFSLRSGYKFPVKFDEIRVGHTWQSVLPLQ